MATLCEISVFFSNSNSWKTSGFRTPLLASLVCSIPFVTVGTAGGSLEMTSVAIKTPISSSGRMLFASSECPASS